jgi:hypothetical protein
MSSWRKDFDIFDNKRLGGLPGNCGFTGNGLKLVEVHG